MADLPRSIPIQVWAPLACSVDLVLAGGEEPAPRRPLTPTGDGTGRWYTEVPAGTLYLLSVDAGTPRPDPRSAAQPYGVHGPSLAVDIDAFDWTDHDWSGREVLGGVCYELHIGTFTPHGTLYSAIERLDHLVDLGVDTVELMPLCPFPGRRGWGYDGVSLYAVHEAYGGPVALQRFVDAAHARGLAVCLDVVYNHFGPSGNYAPVFGPYFTDKHHTPWGAAINLDDDHADGVRAFIIDNALRWLRDFHVDALRLDAVHALLDDSEPHLLAELADAVADYRAATGRRATLIAESDLNQVRMIAPTSTRPGTTGDPALAALPGGLGMDGQWADDVHHALHSWLTGETFGYYVDFGAAATLAQAFEGVFVHDGGYSTFRGRDWGGPVPAEVDRRRFVTFTENHDQVGNRGLGDRPGERIPIGAVAGGTALLLLSPFTPLLFQGQEWGTRGRFQFFTDHEPELGRLVTQGRLREFAQHGWDAIYGPGVDIPDPQAESTFTTSVLDWSELERPEHARVLDWVRMLIRLRRHHLTDQPPQQVSCDYAADWFRLTHGPLTVVAAPRAGASLAVSGTLLASFGDVTHTEEGMLRLGEASVAILRTGTGTPERPEPVSIGPQTHVAPSRGQLHSAGPGQDGG